MMFSGLGVIVYPSIMLREAIDTEKISARNILRGTINRIVAGAVNDEVIIDLTGGNTVTSILTSESVRKLRFSAGMEISAIIQASSVLLAIP